MFSGFADVGFCFDEFGVPGKGIATHLKLVMILRDSTKSPRTLVTTQDITV